MKYKIRSLLVLLLTLLLVSGQSAVSSGQHPANDRLQTADGETSDVRRQRSEVSYWQTPSSQQQIPQDPKPTQPQEPPKKHDRGLGVEQSKQPTANGKQQTADSHKAAGQTKPEIVLQAGRSEERRVGKECRCRWWW